MEIYHKHDVEIGIIGGTGADITLEHAQDYKIITPYGAPSAPLTIGDFNGKRVAFLPRHGTHHEIPPHKLNFQANVWAMHSIGVKRIIAPSAVGGLTSETDKGVFVVVDQYIDRTSNRPQTYHEGGVVCHVSHADPFCPEMGDLFYTTGKELGLNIKNHGTYVCINGPRFSTRAESRMFAQWGGDIVGMTLYPEIALAKELNMCYTTIATVTDLDCWACECEKCGIVMYGDKCPQCGGPIHPLACTVEEILETMAENVEHLRELLSTVIPKIPSEPQCPCKHATTGAFM